MGRVNQVVWPTIVGAGPARDLRWFKRVQGPLLQNTLKLNQGLAYSLSNASKFFNYPS